MKHGLIRFSKPPGPPSPGPQRNIPKPIPPASPSPQRSVPKMGVTAKRRPMSTFVSSDQLNYSYDGTKHVTGWTHLTPSASENFGSLDESIPSDPQNSSERSISPHYWGKPTGSVSSSALLQRQPSRRRTSAFLWKLLGRSSSKMDQDGGDPFVPPPAEPVKMRDKSKRSQRPHSEFAKQKRASFGGFNISFSKVPFPVFSDAMFFALLSLQELANFLFLPVSAIISTWKCDHSFL